ncbi:MAG TPA: DUF3479 domain-containing protein, partial [Pyrinomonadaceae bacterium]|nr:DUF3479 domain-containing protein [Pyrinomonadaceae bacterium]
MKITVLYVGSSLLAPLKNAEREINRVHQLDLRVSAYNFGSPLSDCEWSDVEHDLESSNIVFVIHVMDGENAARLITALERLKPIHDAVIVINCMPELMRRTRMGKLNVGSFASWMERYAKRDKSKEPQKAAHRHHYLKLIGRLPRILKFVPTTGALTDAKHYLYLFCYFLQPTPANIQAMLLYALKHYVHDKRLKRLKLRFAEPENLPAVAIYHPEAPALFQSFDEYQKWHKDKLDPESTIGLLLM